MIEEDGLIYEKKGMFWFSREPTLLEYIGNQSIPKKPNAEVEHSTEITLIAHYTRKGDYLKAEEVIQKLLMLVKP